MPGIAGILTDRGGRDRRADLELMLQSMQHEPLYTTGTCIAPAAGVYSGWVAHPGSFAAAQCSEYDAAGLGVAFAGECVSDTVNPSHSGVMARLYRQGGEAFIEQLNGLFCGLIVDGIERRVLLFNDRYGVERIYVHEAADATYFASEAKALLFVLPGCRSFDEEGVGDYVTYGCALHGRTLFRGVTQLPAASVWSFDGAAARKRRYFDPGMWESQPAMAPRDFADEFQRRFTRVVSRYTAGPMPIGISLTGGVDTRLIMACLSSTPPAPVSYTFAGLEGETRDLQVAQDVAAACGLRHHVLRIERSFLQQFDEHLNRTVYVTDGCAGALGAHEMYLNRKARALAAVRLTGNFGSEVLRAVSTFKPLGLNADLFSPEFRGRLQSSEVRAREESTVTSAAFREIPWSLFGTMAAAKSQVIFRTPYLDNDLVSLAYQTPDVYKDSAAPALQLVARQRPDIARIPTDRAVVYGDGGVSRLLARVEAEASFKLDYLQTDGLPRPLSKLDGVLHTAAKVGLFGRPHRYLLYRRWFAVELSAFVSDALNDSSAVQPYWDRAFVETMARAHAEGRGNYAREINAVVTLAAVQRVLFRTRYTQATHATAVAAGAR
jgi:asparagine synthase (glutamine-hydrolysing)